MMLAFTRQLKKVLLFSFMAMLLLNSACSDNVVMPKDIIKDKKKFEPGTKEPQAPGVPDKP